jgi:hypothetical protein
MPALVGGLDALRYDVRIRREDLKLIDEAVRRNSSAEYLTVVLAGAVVHAVVEERIWSLRRRGRATQFTLRWVQGRYRKGPEARRGAAQARRQRIRELLESGHDAKQIWHALRVDDPKLPLKTVRNIISIIRKG